MSKITALRIIKGPRKRANIFLEGKLAFSLEAEVVAKERLRVGQELSAEQIKALAESDHCQRCLDAAINYISYRPRSESELRTKLSQRGFDSDTQETVIARLKEQRLGGDMTFAQFWKENRETFSPRSRWLTGLELRRKGVASDIIDQVVGTIDDEDNAYRAARSKAYRLSRCEHQDFQRRLGDFLKRRGFNYEVINRIVERLWQEKDANSSYPGLKPESEGKWKQD
ncbi:MAG: RecX family transcriptional regulator [Chloroflexi bacterium]|nr:RecX family transcriptional regulator [Chloroflexota bacterium]